MVHRPRLLNYRPGAARTGNTLRVTLASARTIREMSAAERSRKGIHIKLGELTVADSVERFIVARRRAPRTNSCSPIGLTFGKSLQPRNGPLFARGLQPVRLWLSAEADRSHRQRREIEPGDREVDGVSSIRGPGHIEQRQVVVECWMGHASIVVLYGADQKIRVMLFR